MAIKYAPQAGGGGAVRHDAGRRLRDRAACGARAGSAELYMGLVEVGVGVIPAGGGCKEMLLRFGDAQKAFELIGYAKVSASAAEARSLGLLRDGGCRSP